MELFSIFDAIVDTIFDTIVDTIFDTIRIPGLFVTQRRKVVDTLNVHQSTSTVQISIMLISY